MAENNDLILDEGFPVLSDFKPGLSEADRFPVPRDSFASYTNAITFAQRSSFLDDCALVFNARATEGDEYSSGSTFFLPSLMKPRCALEALAQTIFKAHTEGLEGKFDPKNSGAEWWTLVLDNKTSQNDPPSKNGNDDDSEEEEDDEVGMHFDADYALEEQASGVFLHPRVATITYLSDVGVPTLILDKRSPPPQDREKSSLNGSITKGWLSHPSFGKHVSFDGRLLHGAPGEYFPSTSTRKSNDDEGDSEPQTKKQKVEEKTDVKEDGALAGKRITFLVNIWLNHSTMDAVILDDDLVSKLSTTWEDPDSNAKSDEDHVPAFQWNMKDIFSSQDKLTNTVSLSKSTEAAGIEDIVLCNRHVDMAFNSSLGDLHDASKLAAKEGSMPLVFEEGVLTLTVGREASDDEDEESEED
eukprot:scaffold947_cov155-Skeletonema_menzelii.AAC.8